MRPPQTIVITGANNGIGAALALKYAAPGITLGLIARNTERLEQIALQCQQKGAVTEQASIDVTDHTALQHWLQHFDQKHPIDLLIANAGITSLPDPQQGESLEKTHQVLHINLHGTINSVHAILDAMRQRGSGQIALVSSLAAYRGMPITPAYCASKAAVKSYGEALRGWLAPQGIKINVICPGFVKSDMSNRFNAPKPFMITADKAATLIQRSLQRNKACIAFPFPLNLGMWFLSFLPFPVASFFLGISGYNRSR